jgi:DNA-directed RNA polymerase specialized sigma24 family protein
MAHQEDANDVDWGRVYVETVRAARLLTRRGVEELVQEAMKLYFGGKAPWSPSQRESLPEHLALVGLNARSKAERIERRRRHPRIMAKVIQALYHPPPTPEDELSKAQENQRKEELFQQLLEDLADDPEATRIVLLEQDGVHEPAEQAKRAPMDIGAVRNARKRIKRCMQALIERDQEGAVKA